MKSFFSYCFLPALLLVFLQPVNTYAQDQYADSLRQVMQTASRESDRLHAAVLLARDLVPAEMDSARAMLESAEALTDSEELLHRAYYYSAWGLFYWYTRERQLSINQYMRVLQLKRDPSIVHLQAEAANHTGLLYYQLGVADSARIYLYKAFEIDQERGNKQGMAKNMYDLSRLHRSQSQYELAFTYITEAINLQREFGEPRLLPFLYNVLGITHAALDERELAVAAYEQSLQFALEQELDKEVTIFYNNMAALWCEVGGMLEQTLHYAETGLEKARASGYTDLIASLLVNKGQAFLTAGKPAEALELFNEAMEYNRQLNRQRVEMDINYRVGRANKVQGNFDEARQAQRRALELAQELQSLSYQSDALLELAAMDSLENRHEDFRRHYVHGIRLRDSIWSQENRSRIAELQIIHETEQKELEIEQLRQQEQVRQLRMTVIVAASGFVFVLLSLVILYLGIRQKLARQKYAMQQQQAESRLEANRRELTGKALSLAKSDQLIMQLKKDLRTMLDNTGDDHSKDLRSALKLLKTKDNSQQLWQEFETRFNELNEGFISRLTARYPDLSPAEVRLCAMLRLQLTTKEIADMIKRSTRTVENTRNSIRKKMGLQPGANLVQLLLQI